MKLPPETVVAPEEVVDYLPKFITLIPIETVRK
jgi:hypothetical protein